jgi:trehalose/maltose hydrolase-like predicted phosphorylase
VIQHLAFAVEPWALRETELSPDVLAQSEPVFALGNGHIGLRAHLDEGEPTTSPAPISTVSTSVQAYKRQAAPGTLFFNVTTYRARHAALHNSSYHKLVWRP